MSSLPWLQAEIVDFEADSDRYASESESDLCKEGPTKPQVQASSQSEAVKELASEHQRRDNSAFWGPIRRERWRQRKLKENEPFITIRDWLLTGTYPHSNVMINAGLYGIDVSDWKDEDFECLKPERT